MHSHEPSEAPLPDRPTVAVVGAGYAGLAAALRLADSGVDVVVLEASDRLGGRTCTDTTADGTVVDHGGQWVGPTQRRLLEMADRFGVGTFATYSSGDHIELWSDGTQRRYRIGGPEDGPGVAAYLQATEVIDKLAATVDLDDPAATPDAERRDAETCEAYFARTVPDADALARLTLAVEGVLTVEPRDISVLHLLFYVASAGSFEQLMEVEGCAQERRFTAGAQETARKIGDALGMRVLLDTPVERLEQDDDSVRLRTPRGELTADRVIVATPPSATLQIPVTPPLPVARRRWLERSPMGDVAKIHVVYGAPFWRERGLSGEATTYGSPSVGVVFDNSPEDASRGVLVCFVYAERLHRWSRLPDSERRSEVLELLVELFGERAGRPLGYVEKNWSNDPWVHGGYAANPTPGTWIEHSRAGWRSPVGRLHWAGAESASIWNGYIDGAISSGERAADEVFDALGVGSMRGG